MLDQKDILIFIHLLAFAVALGGSIYHVFILPSVLQKKSDKKSNIKITAHAISTFSSINFVMLIAIVFSGVLLIFTLYEKISNISSSLYLNAFFIKIVFVTIIFSIAAYQTFNLRFKIITLNMDKINNEDLPKPFSVMRTCSLINIVLITLSVLLGVVMSSVG